MTADEQRHQLVAQVTVRRGVALLVALLEQDVEHRVAARLPAPLRHQLEQHLVEALDRHPEAAPGAVSPEVAHHERHRQDLRQRPDRAKRRFDHGAQPRRLAPVGGAEHDPQDHFEGQLAHPVKRHHAPVPGAQLAARELGDHRRERAHPLAVERALQQPSLADVLGSVEQQDRVLARERAQELPALAGRRDRRIEPEDLAHRVGVGEQHHRLLGPVGADRDRVAIALVDAAHERRRARHPRDRLPQRRGARAGRELHAAIVRAADSVPVPAERGASR